MTKALAACDESGYSTKALEWSLLLPIQHHIQKYVHYLYSQYFTEARKDIEQITRKEIFSVALSLPKG